MEEFITVKEIFQILKKQLKLIIATALGTLILGAVITFFIMTPQYEKSTQILVNQSQNASEESGTTDIESSKELLNTYNVIITSPAILEPAIENSNFGGSVEELRSKITVLSEGESQVTTITVKDDDPKTAKVIANSIGTTFEQKIPEIMNIDNVSILSEAQTEESTNPVSPQPLLNLFLFLFIGLLLGISFAFLIEFLDKSIKTEQDLERELNIPILGTVPMIEEKDTNKFNTNSSSRLGVRGSEKTS